MATTRAKFHCGELMQRSMMGTDGEGNPVRVILPSIVMTAVTPPYVDLPNGTRGPDPNHENTLFWTASPSGRLEMSISNPLGAEVFEVGRDYYLDFTLAPDETPRLPGQ